MLRPLLALPFLLGSFVTLAGTPPPDGASCLDTIHAVRADYIDTLQVADRANPRPLATVEAGGEKIALLSYFPEIIVRQNGRIIVFGMLDDLGQISKIYTKEPKATMEMASLGDKAHPCLVVRWEEAVQEGEGEAMYKFVQVWDIGRRVCLANERWSASAGPLGSTRSEAPPVGCAAEVSLSGGKLVIGEKTCPPGGTAQPRTPVRVDAPGTYWLLNGRFARLRACQ